MALAYGALLFAWLPHAGIAWWTFLWLRSREGDSQRLRVGVVVAMCLLLVASFFFA